MRPQRTLLTRRLYGASRDGQFNRLSELLHRTNKDNSHVTKKKLSKGLDNFMDSIYNLNLER